MARRSICPNCRLDNELGSTHCVGCGTPLPTAGLARREAAGPKLAGMWRGEDTVIEFRPNGVLLYDGRQLRYKATDDTIQIDGISDPWSFKLEAEALTLTVLGETSVLTRSADARPAPPPRPRA